MSRKIFLWILTVVDKNRVVDIEEVTKDIEYSEKLGHYVQIGDKKVILKGDELSLVVTKRI